MGSWLKRVVFFMMVNIFIIVTITIILNLLGIHRYLSNYGIDYVSLAIFCLIWGMVGSFFSLLLSKFLAKVMLRVKVIDPNTSDPLLRDLVQTVYRLAQSAGITKMPEVGIYPSPEVNAFATGPSKNNALVAVSEGLLQRMNKSEIEGVLGHEVAHIANGDMVTMTLIQGVINAFVMFFARIFAYALSQSMRKNERDISPLAYTGLVVLFEIIFGILGMIVVAYFSRVREYAADKGGAKLAGTPKMIAALEALKRTYNLIDTSHKSLATLKISGKPSGFMALFATHPSLDDRINRLKKYL